MINIIIVIALVILIGLAVKKSWSSFKNEGGGCAGCSGCGCSCGSCKPVKKKK